MPRHVGDILRGHVFVPFHYGYWDGKGDEHDRAANELTLTGWDPVSKQPYFKYAAVQVRKARGASLTGTVADLAGKAVDRVKELTDKVLSAQLIPSAAGLPIISASSGPRTPSSPPPAAMWPRTILKSRRSSRDCSTSPNSPKRLMGCSHPCRENLATRSR